MKKVFFLLSLAVAAASCKDAYNDLPDGLYADIETNKGHIVLKLAYEKAPVTVANFVTLAEGKNTFVSEKYKGRPFYDGLTFHRVVPDFMIQGGDPDGNGSGTPGYRFKDEFSDLRHDKPGTLSMANAGPATNGSQFFITHVATPFLDGRHTVFGYVVGEDDMGTVNAIEAGDAITSVTIVRKGEAAKRFDAVKTFSDYVGKDRENQKKQAAIDAENKRVYDEKYKAVKDQKAAELAAVRRTMTKTPTGLEYKIVKKGNGKKPGAGETIFFYYAGYFENGEMFDSNVEAVARQFGKYDPQRAAQMGYMPAMFQAGRKDGMIPGFLEGLEKLSVGDKAVVFIPPHLGYGEQGTRNVIPPNANLVFELELVPEPKM
jgi:peptidylprolyl isomerase